MLDAEFLVGSINGLGKVRGVGHFDHQGSAGSQPRSNSSHVLRNIRQVFENGTQYDYIKWQHAGGTILDE